MAVKTLTSRLQRPAVLVLIGAGWLSILGNSPPERIEKKLGARSGVIVVSIARKEWDSGCSAQGSLSAPVRKASLVKDDQVVHEVTCLDDTDCMRFLVLPPEIGGCTLIRGHGPDSGPPDVGPIRHVDAADDAVALDAAGDTGRDSAPEASPADAQPEPADALVADARATDASIEVLRQSQPLQQDSIIEVWSCSGYAERPVEIRYTRSRSARDYSACSDEGGRYKVIVETAAGQTGSQEYRIDVDPPDGYFGC
jgi:hypothetical protein